MLLQRDNVSSVELLIYGLSDYENAWLTGVTVYTPIRLGKPHHMALFVRDAKYARIASCRP